MSIFGAKAIVNDGRQVELDLLKSLSIMCCLVSVHILDEYMYDFNTSLTWTVNNIFGRVLGAPVFMVAMGVGMAFSTHRSWEDMTWRGFKLLCFGQTLNIFRYGIAYTIGARTDPDYFNPMQVLNFSSDIMQLAGIAFLFVGITRVFNLNSIVIFILSMLMSGAGTLLTGVETGHYMVDQLLGLFWPTHTESYFPFLIWFVFIAFGQVLGEALKRTLRKGLFYGFAIPIGCIMAAIYCYMQIFTYNKLFGGIGIDESRYCWMNLIEALTICSFMPALMGFAYIVSLIIPDSFNKVLSYPSYHINKYYCVSWAVITLGSSFYTLHNNSDFIATWMYNAVLTSTVVIIYVRHFCETIEDYVSDFKLILVPLVWIITLYLAFHAYNNYDVMPNFLNNYLEHWSYE